MPEIKVVAPVADFEGIVQDQNGTSVDLHDFAGRRVKRATRIGNRVAVHLVGSAPGELIVFASPDDYEKSIRRDFASS